MEPEPMLNDDCVGPDGRLRLRCCLPHAHALSLSTYCCGRYGCHRTARLGVMEAVRLVGKARATIGDVERRLHCDRTGPTSAAAG